MMGRCIYYRELVLYLVSDHAKLNNRTNKERASDRISTLCKIRANVVVNLFYFYV